MTKIFILLLVGTIAAVTVGTIAAVTVDLGFQPMPPESNVERTLIWYNASSDENTLYWRQQLDKFLIPYTDDTQDPVYTQCENGVPPEPGSNTVCDVTMTQWKACTNETAFNFNSSKGGPCIFLQLNKVFGWIPEYYNSTTMSKQMPAELKKHILDIEKQYGPDSNKLNVIWVSCEGENQADIENIGFRQYYPKFGFDGKYFPFLNVPHYISPIVAVHFEQPVRGVLINIECQAWAKNIVHNGLDKSGSVHFELMVDS